MREHSDFVRFFNLNISIVLRQHFQQINVCMKRARLGTTYYVLPNQRGVVTTVLNLSHYPTQGHRVLLEENRIVEERTALENRAAVLEHQFNALEGRVFCWVVFRRERNVKTEAA